MGLFSNAIFFFPSVNQRRYYKTFSFAAQMELKVYRVWE